MGDTVVAVFSNLVTTLEGGMAIASATIPNAAASVSSLSARANVPSTAAANVGSFQAIANASTAQPTAEGS